METYLHVDIDSFYVSVEEIYDPELRGIPAAVYSSRRGTPIESANYLAKQYGVDSGMPVSEALKRCSLLRLIEENPERYEEASINFFQLLKEINNEMEPYGNDEAWLLYDKLEKREEIINQARKIKTTVKEKLSLPVTVGYGRNKLQAKVATNCGKPDGLFGFLDKEEYKEVMHPRPARELPGIGPKTEAILNELAVYTIGDLSKAPLYTFNPYFGRWWDTVFHLKADGIDYSSFEPWYRYKLPKSIGNTLGCYYFDEKQKRWCHFTQEQIVDGIRRLSSVVADRMEDEDLHGRTMTLSVRFVENGKKMIYKAVTSSKTRKQLFRDDKTIFLLAEELYSNIRIDKEISRVGIHMSNLVKGWTQLRLI